MAAAHTQFAFSRRALVLWFTLVSSLQLGYAAISPSQVLVLVNRDQKISSQVASVYQRLRAIPAENVLRLPLGADRNISPDLYWRKAAEPVKQYLEQHTGITCIVTTSGVPYTIWTPNVDAIAFDSELAAVLRKTPGDRSQGLPNPLFMNVGNPYGITLPRVLKMVYVSRLDGPDLATITRMIEDALAVEKTGFAGPVFGDAQGIDGITGYGAGDYSIRSAIDLLSGAGFKAVLDMKQESWKQPKGGVGSQAAGAAFYEGWYDLLNFQNIFGDHGLARGSIAWHIASEEAQNIWSPNGGWCLGLMRTGAAVTLGPVREPYVAAFPHGDIFMEALLSGASVGESYWLSLPQMSWAMVILGDPLYRPFAAKPQPALAARAYVADNRLHILQAGETAPLLVRVECIGPPGSFTPPMVANVSPGVGLAAASGSVSIPALNAGESTVVRIPGVTAGNDPTGMFRLNFDVQGASRRIVLEGRIGFSRLTGGLSTKTQMFPDPAGRRVLSGLPGRSFLVDSNTLQLQSIPVPSNVGIASAEFAPGGGHAVMNLYDPRQKVWTAAVTDGELQSAQSLKPGSQFLHWLESDTLLLNIENRLFAASAASLQETDLGIPAAGGDVIPGTKISIQRTADGKFEYRNGAGPARELLPEVHLAGPPVVAADLSVLGGIDTEKRLWVQHGQKEQPSVIATGVERVEWSPRCHRVLVQAADQKSRVYDTRDRTWVDLGRALAAAWSQDDNRLLYVESVSPSEIWLSLLSGRATRRVTSGARIGSISKMSFSKNDDFAFLLAGLSNQANVWIVALPQT